MEDCETFLILCCGAAAAVILEEEKSQYNNKKPRQWVREWVRRRNDEGCCSKLLKELRLETPSLYSNFLRMNSSDFDYLLKLVTPLIKKQTTKLRQPISPTERLAVTLRYLATGESFRSLQYVFRIPHNTISGIIPEVCDAIYSVLQPNYLKIPSSEEEWKSVSEKFLQLWNFPNCIGSIDGKHVVMTAPTHSGSVYYNYKGTHSIVLMAISDASYKFLYIDVGSNGRISDGGVFRKCSFHNALVNKKLNIPPPKPLPMRTMPVPYLLVADDAFALTPNLIKPFSARNMNAMQRVFNYRLSRARRVIENAFGIMSARFRVMRSPIKLEPLKTRQITLACCVLHNFLMSQQSSIYFNSNLVDHYSEDGTLIPGEWRNEQIGSSLSSIQTPSYYIAPEASKIREEFSQYFVEEGEVSFQYKHI
ncbi:putative nuclease HARBI1 [Calliphora vicina]|uniref:putative nuclease HARBI1 n=1 Tax=Calliphora vicina TaxID=7373 RepID=UPI00325B1E0B